MCGREWVLVLVRARAPIHGESGFSRDPLQLAACKIADGVGSQCARKRTHIARWKSVSGQAKAS